MRLHNRIAWSAVVVLLMPVVTHAQESKPGELIVRIYNAIGFARGDLHVAQDTAGEILRATGAKVRWRECRSPDGPSRASIDGCDDVLHRAELAVRLVTAPRKSLGTAGTLGYSLVDVETRAGALSTVFGDRVVDLASRLRINRASLLGRVIAHELGHLLLGTVTHTREGLMRAFWTDAALQERQYWQFSEVEAAQISAALQVRGVLPSDQVLAAAPPMPHQALVEQATR